MHIKSIWDTIQPKNFHPCGGPCTWQFAICTVEFLKCMYTLSCSCPNMSLHVCPINSPTFADLIFMANILEEVTIILIFTLYLYFVVFANFLICGFM